MFFVLLLAIFTMYIVIDIDNIAKTLKEIQKGKVTFYINNNIPTLSTLLKFGFYDELNQEIKKLVQTSDGVLGLEIITPTKKFSYFRDLKNKNIYQTSLKMKNNNTIYKVYFNQKKILDIFFEKYYTRFIIYIMFFFPFILYMFFYIRKKIKKINLLAKNVENINFRKIMHIEKIDNYYEIINVTNAINKLLNQINLFYNAQKNMLRRIVKLKKHLETAQKIAQIFSWEYDCVNKNIQITHQFKKFLGVKGTIFKAEEFIEFFDVEVINVISKLDKNCNECKEFELIHKIITVNNKEYYFKTIGKCIKTKNKHFMICVSLNITDDVKKQQKIEHLAYHDPLTSLPNRTYLKEQFQLIINMAKRENKKFAVLYLDMDNFKIINDTLGHESGDKLLINVSYKLKTILRKSDLVARIGGDEFVIILNDISSKEDVVEVINKLIRALKQPIIIKQTSISPTFSIGCALYPDDSENPVELLRYADIAMYEAKNKGKNNYAFINEDLKKQMSEFYLITNELKQALNNNELVLFYQPKIDIITNRVYGAEGLIRWNHPKRGLLTPFHFIPYAEKSNLISQIDRYVIKKAIETLKNWEKDELLKDMHLAVNISANEFRQQDFVSNLRKLVDEYKIDPSKLEIEITETLSMQNFAYAVGVLEEVKRLGVKIALDDFGTGYSSLNYLKKLPFDILKIDQTFIRDLEKDNDDLLITKMIIEISKVLNKVNVAEGVENKELLKIVSELGCQYVQGYYFAKPLENKEFFEYVKNFDFEKIQ